AVPPATRAAKRAAREKPTETVRETFDASRFLAPKRARPGERVLSADAPPPSMEVAGIVPARGLPATPFAPVVAPPPPAPKAEAPAPERPRAGGDFQEPKLIAGPQPQIPMLAKERRVYGTVRLEATIAKDGRVKDVTVLGGHPFLISAAREAALG